MDYTLQSAFAENDTPHKPFEDFMSTQRDTFVVADGVTRPHDEYYPGQAFSSAARAAAITAQSLCRGLAAAGDPTAAAKDAAMSAIRAVGAYNAAHPGQIPAAAVFVCASVRGDTLHFAYLGDSVIMLLRDGLRIPLTQAQTAHLRVYGSSSGLKISRLELHRIITNNPDHPLGYGVINGDERALAFLRAGSISLRSHDRVIISSDGLDKYLLYTGEDRLLSQSPQEMIASSAPYDRPPYANRADDKAVITLDFVNAH